MNRHLTGVMVAVLAAAARDIVDDLRGEPG